MTIEVEAVTDAVASHAMTTGLFDRVNTFEPKSAPGYGVTAAVWAQSIEPAPNFSGLNGTAVRFEMTLRIYTSMSQDPPDMIDVNLIKAVDAMLAAYSNDFTLDSLVAHVDLLGAHGSPLQANAGYIELDGRMMRVMDITVPLIIDNVWGQVA